MSDFNEALERVLAERNAPLEPPPETWWTIPSVPGYAISTNLGVRNLTQPTTIKNVAQYCRLPIPTVKEYIYGGRVSDKWKVQIESAITELGWEPGCKGRPSQSLKMQGRAILGYYQLKIDGRKRILSIPKVVKEVFGAFFCGQRGGCKKFQSTSKQIYYTYEYKRVKSGSSLNICRACGNYWATLAHNLKIPIGELKGQYPELDPDPHIYLDRLDPGYPKGDPVVEED